MITITTARLICTQIAESDWDFFHALQTDPQVMYYVADLPSNEEIRAAFESRLPCWSPQSSHWLCLVVSDKATGKKLGVTGYIHRGPDCAEVGFLFAPDAQGLGYGTESLRAVCDYAFREGGIERLIATVTAGNLASRRLLEKVGFTLEQELHESYRLRDQLHNDWLFGLTRNA
ncbi:GNAT family N-acetyltransferase [Pseudescherichia sp.]|uniref:GNAT family N-acetyltransferase n=1 Tax=Pseudescherichia sp. TaxID=2055881 RepID=UPI002897F518|nr:GNAT family N-acetyltransferase [Pseudescherichia sp.]